MILLKDRASRNISLPLAHLCFFGARKRYHIMSATLSRRSLLCHNVCNLMIHNVYPVAVVSNRQHSNMTLLPTTYSNHHWHHSLNTRYYSSNSNESSSSQEKVYLRPSKRPKTLAALSTQLSSTTKKSNDNRSQKGTTNDKNERVEMISDSTKAEIRDTLDIRVLQYCRDPRSFQFRTILDYFGIPYHCIEVSPFYKHEFELLGIEKENWHAPYVTILNKKSFNDQFVSYKERSIKLLSKYATEEHKKLNLESLIQTGNVQNFKDKIEYIVDKNFTHSFVILILILMLILILIFCV